MSSPVWFITGASNGFGLYLCLRALRAGHRAIGSVRNRTKSADAVKQIESAGGKIVELDLNDSQENITKKIKAVGQIDYLVNNAGFFVLGAVEQVTEKEAQLQLQTNFFGPLYTTQAALEGMRARRSGTIVNITSIAAKDPQPTSGMYAASKAALEGLSESLAAEVAPFNISVLIVEPGAFRTNFLAALSLPEAPLSPDYDGTVVAQAREKFLAYDGKQVGDPLKGVDRIFEAVAGEGMAGHLKGKVRRLVIGRDALERNRKAIDRFTADLALAEEVALSTDY
ncbi:NAD(P)-binding protein [Hypomontagnella submonticulosa]|nr:NAD(P)-binding protein [Hypomontagnella submonticulosa]